MDNFVWRFCARVVAYLGLHFTFATEIYVVFVSIQSLIHMPNAHFAAWVAMLVVLLQNILVGLQFWATLKLLKATQVGRDSEKALKNSRIWLNVNIVVVGIGSVYKFFSIHLSSSPETIVWSVEFIIVCVTYLEMMFIVYKFIKELERVATSDGSAAGFNSLKCCL